MSASRYYPDEAAAILEAAQEAAAAKSWPDWLIAGIVRMLKLADDRAGVNGFPLRGAWLATAAAILVADLDEEPAPGWTKFAGFVGDAANRALKENQQAGAFPRIWAEVKGVFLSAASAAGAAALSAAETAAGTTAFMGQLLILGAGLGLAWTLYTLANGGRRGR